MALLVNRSNIRLLFEAYKHSATVFFSGAIELGIGILTILTHNLWVSDFRIIITLFGWLALIRGMIRLFVPDMSRKWLSRYEKSKQLPALLVITLLLGTYLALVGFRITF